jgi:tetratricopeptide (TPR) repeat protein
VEQAQCLNNLAWLLYDRQTARRRRGSRIPRSISHPGERPTISGLRISSYSWHIYHSKGEREKAIYHFEAALGIASSFNWHDQLFWIHYSLAELFLDEGRFDDAHAHVERAKSHAVDNAYYLGRAMELQARFGTSSTGLKRRGLRLCAPPMFMRSSGLRRMWRTVDSQWRRTLQRRRWKLVDNLYASVLPIYSLATTVDRLVQLRTAYSVWPTSGRAQWEPGHRSGANP